MDWFFLAFLLGFLPFFFGGMVAWWRFPPARGGTLLVKTSH